MQLFLLKRLFWIKTVWKAGGNDIQQEFCKTRALWLAKAVQRNFLFRFNWGYYTDIEGLMFCY